MIYKVLGVILIVIGAVIGITIIYNNSQQRQQGIVFAPRFMLNALWETYKEDYWDASTGRTIDKQRGNITTSEGQSYTLLRAVWLDDKATFDLTWQWTKNNLQRTNDSLLSWLYGQKTDGSYGILTDQGGQNSASDADSDTALALLFASARWQHQSYKNEALRIIRAMWEHEVVTINGEPYFVANNLEKNSTTSAIINPSYLSPYAYKIFAVVDRQHAWNRVADSSYRILNEATTDSLDKNSSANLPPDWIVINVQTGKIQAAAGSGLTTNFSYDALRTPLRITLDWQWNGDSRAKSLLEKFSFLEKEWNKHQKIQAGYTHDGQPLSQTEVPAFYGGTIGYFMSTNPKLAENIYKNKLQALYNTDSQTWKTGMSYYDDNLAWFGLALYNNFLINLIPSSLNAFSSPAPQSPQALLSPDDKPYSN